MREWAICSVNWVTRASKLLMLEGRGCSKLKDEAGQEVEAAGVSCNRLGAVGCAEWAEEICAERSLLVLLEHAATTSFRGGMADACADVLTWDVRGRGSG